MIAGRAFRPLDLAVREGTGAHDADAAADAADAAAELASIPVPRTVSTAIPPALYLEVEAACVANRCTMRRAVRDALELWLRVHG